MKKIFTLVALSFALVMNAQDNPQIVNGDFESWENVSKSNHAPDSWNSFETAEGSFASTVKAQQVTRSEDVRPGSTGTSSAKINSRAVKLFGITLAVAQGNLTTGCINAGSTSAANKMNYNFSKTSDESKSMKFTGKPTAMKVWVKLVQASVDENYSTARVTAVIHDAHDYITYGQDSDDTEENKSYVVAKGEVNFNANGGEWQQITVPFDYDSYTNDDPQYIIINFSTNSYPGKGKEGDELYIDDIEMVYEQAPVVEDNRFEKEYTDNMVVIINDISSEPMPTTISLSEQEDGKYALALKNFMLVSDGDVMPVGTININDIEPTVAEDGTMLVNMEQSIMLMPGDIESIEMWMGPMICLQVGAIPVSIKAELSADKEQLLAEIDIDLSSVLQQKVKVLFGQKLIDENATKISEMQSENNLNQKAIYNLHGQKVGKDFNGIIIVNGKKIIKK